MYKSSLILKLFFLYFIFTSFALSSEFTLDDLLDEYRDLEELHLKTKKETAGFLRVYSRQDLDSMQAFTLNDVLKTLRMYTLQTDRVGMASLVKGGGTSRKSSNVKIYINSYRLNSTTMGNAVTQYGKMGLYFIDHIEIYQTSDSVAFGDEPGSMIIKLYTKKPARENGTFAQFSIDSEAGSNLRFMDARVFDEYSYLANIDMSKNNFDTYPTATNTLSRDGERGQAFFQFSKQDSYDLELGFTREKYDPLSGFGMALESGEIKTENNRFSFVKYFDNLQLGFSLSRERLNFYDKDKNGIMLFDGTFSKSIEAEIETDIYSVYLEKNINYKNNEITLRAQAKQKNVDIEKFKSNNVEKALAKGPEKLNIYMLSFRDVYTIDKNNILSFSAKVDKYDDDYMQEITQPIFRIGYLSKISKEWSFKAFVMKNYMYPTFMQTTFSPIYNINPTLKAARNLALATELTYKKDNICFTFGYGRSETKNSITFNQTQKKYVNSPKTSDNSRVYANYDYQFDLNNKLRIEYFKLFKKNYYSPGYGGLLQIFNKIGKFDIYNELIFRSSYTSIDKVKMSAGYDYSLGIMYPINKKLILKLKGENLFNKASKVPINGVKIPALDRRALLTMEYTF